MSNCYKCQKELPDGQIECEPFCAPDTLLKYSDDDIEELEQKYLDSTVPIDWDKVKTFEDLVLILKNSPLVEDRIDRD